MIQDNLINSAKPILAILNVNKGYIGYWVTSPAILIVANAYNNFLNEKILVLHFRIFGFNEVN